MYGVKFRVIHLRCLQHFYISEILCHCMQRAMSVALFQPWGKCEYFSVVVLKPLGWVVFLEILLVQSIFLRLQSSHCMYGSSVVCELASASLVL